MKSELWIFAKVLRMIHCRGQVTSLMNVMERVLQDH